MVRKRRASGPSRSADGSLALSDEKRLELIEKAFIFCSPRKTKPTEKQVADQFFKETGRKPGEIAKRYRGGHRSRMW